MSDRVQRYALAALIAASLTEFFARFFWPDGFGRPVHGDEIIFRPAWTQLTDTTVSIADRIDGYAVLNAPLALVVFGIAERLAGGLWAPRVLVTCSALAVLALAGRRRVDTTTSLQIVAGILVVPHFLRSSTVAYTDVVASLFVVLALLAYHRHQHVRAAVWCALGIACRQYIVAFPVAIALWETARWHFGVDNQSATPPKDLVRTVLAPYVVASATLLGWFAVFGGLTTQAASEKIGNVPDVQQRLFALDPEAGLFFLSALGLMFVLPELFISPATSLRAEWSARTAVAVAVPVTVVAVLFPFNPQSVMWGFNRLELSNGVEFAVFLVLAVLAAVRFARFDLGSAIVWTHALMLMKSYPWSKYVLPVVVALWLLHGLRGPDSSTTAARTTTRSRPEPVAAR